MPKPQEGYEQLSIYLDKENWKEADKETMQILLRIGDQIIRGKRGIKIDLDRPTRLGWLEQKIVEQIPVESLQAIDNLWLRASKKQFGYSVQKQIWLDIARNSTKSFGVLFAEFADQVGWLVDGRWTLSYDDFNFSLDAPDGHLPTFWFEKSFLPLGTQEDTFKYFFVDYQKFPE
ncbi:GUN4 domain-containing protein [Microcystis aeruginosa]|uniref:GUN4-like domain-containing protein n=1 Tax=Microcystis aeruginosa FD4 TaxID=2686288 RepID=A0A857DAW3_MICAE|nr:GUN4 domain-containing protein [Microcystis aeruginosa]QGZ92683.1 hypothetical protein GQR42_06310 [Microcystis aeruginosa FD4]